MPRPLKRPEQPIDPYKAQPLPLGRPAAVYYRQSSEGQIGNISTTLQTIDMIEHLLERGWLRESVHMIDADAAVSGTKKIRERKGMSQLYDLIEAGQIGLVAAQDVDRFFRDVTMIETNLFIDACKRNNVQVMTPRMVYDFAHPVMGSSHIKMFREEAQRAADYLEYQIRGRLVKARHSRSAGGMWSGRKILPGFMVDCRAKVNEQRNPDFRKYKRFDLYADVALRYFELFRENNGNLFQTWRFIERNGPYFPDIVEGMVPEGFKATDHLDRRSLVTGKLTPSHTGLEYMLINVAYIGHWVHMGAVVQWNNHEPIIPLDLFMYAFNRLSPTDFHGEPNPDYVPYRPWIRHDKAERCAEPPTYSGLIYTDDLPAHPHKRLAGVWNSHAEKYEYLLNEYPYRSTVWKLRAFILDELIDEMLLDRLLSVTAQPSMGTPTAHSFTYDADGRMVTSGTRQFLWDEVSTYGDIVAEFDGGQLDASYVLGGSRLISQTTGTDSAYFLTDALGSTRALSDGVASLTDTFTYDAYGGLYSADPFADFSTTATPYLFTGHRYDSALGLYHARARVYDPAVGRFLSRDTWPVNYSNPVELNRYAYVAGNPVNATDPTGNTIALPSYGMITRTYGSIINILTYAASVAASCSIMNTISFLAAAAKDAITLISIDYLIQNPICKLPILYFSLIWLPNISQHIFIAQYFGTTIGEGQQAEFIPPQPMLLFYLGPNMQGNRPSCAPARKAKIGLPRQGYQCDEYPFASTRQNTGSASIKPVPTYEQFGPGYTQASEIARFYRTRLNYQPGWFAVVVRFY